MLSPSFTTTGVPVFVSRCVEPGTYVLINGTAYFHSQAELDAAIRRLNYPLRCRRHTRAMRGNARRRDLIRKVRERTTSTADFAVAT